MKPYDDSAWFNDPATLRERAEEYDRLWASSSDPHIADAWRGKARALRSRAGAIERVTASGMSAEGQDAERLGAKPASPAPPKSGETPNV